MKKLILASGSVQRKTMMDGLNIPYEIIPADIDEKAIRDDNLKLRAEKIARAKATKVAQKHEGIIIAADTFAAYGTHVLEKPVDLADAKRMLRMHSGNTGVCYSGFCYIDRKSQIDFSTAIEIKFTCRKILDHEIEEYIKSYPVLTWSAATSPAYSYPASFFSEVHGSLTGFTHGLPMDILVPLLHTSEVF